MSQYSKFYLGTGAAPIEHIDADAGIVVVPDGTGGITVAGGNNITTTGTANTLTIDVTGTTQYAVQVGDATGSLDSLAVGSANQIMQSAGAGSNPAWSSATYPATTTQGDVLYSSAANVITSLAKDATATRYISNTGASNNPAWAQINLANGVTGTLPVGNGGSGASTFTDHGVLLGSGATAFSVTAVGATGEVLKGNTGADPTFGAVDLTTDITGILPVANGGTGLSTITDHGIMVGSGAGNVTPLAVGATGETVMGSTGADPTWTGSPSFSGTATGGTGLVATTGDVTVSAGNLNLPTTNAALTQGVIEINGVRYFHAFGTDNLFIGSNAGNGTMGAAVSNIGIGDDALSSLTGVSNGDHNVAIGEGSCETLTTGYQNTAIGAGSLRVATDAHQNMAIGINSMVSATSAGLNIAIGSNALNSLTTGDYNICLGASSGSSLTTSDSDNICISNSGTATDNNTIRIGTQGTGSGQQDTTFIAGIYNTTPSGGNDGNVIIDSNGQLGTIDAYPIVWSEVTGTSQAAVVNAGYILNNASQVELTLPATASVGSVVRAIGLGAGGWKIKQNASQYIRWDESNVTTTGTGGYLESTDDHDAVELICTVTNNGWSVLSSKGNITIV